MNDIYFFKSKQKIYNPSDSLILDGLSFFTIYSHKKKNTSQSLKGFLI